MVNISPARFETADRALDEAIVRSIRAGFVYVLSAGGIANLDGYSPQRVTEAITVGSTDAADAARQSGYGPHLTIFAPGIRIQGAGSASDTAEYSGDGDSYAAPFVAGVAALYLQRHPHATPAEVKAAILSSGHPGRRHECGNRSGAAAPRDCRLVTPTYNLQACASPSRLWHSWLSPSPHLRNRRRRVC